MASATNSGRNDVSQRVLHALDLGMLGDWEGAKRSLEHLEDPIVPRLISLLTEQQRREKERSEAQAIARHELGNAISIAQANIEAMVDGVLEATPERLSAIRDALQMSGSLLDDLKRQHRRKGEANAAGEHFDVCGLIAEQVHLIGLIAEQVHLIAPIAESKNVRIRFGCPDPSGQAADFQGDPDAVAHAVRHVLLSAVRYTPPGGAISIDCVPERAELLLSVSGSRDPQTNGRRIGFSLLSKLLEAVGGQARVLAQSGEQASLAIPLAAVPRS